MAYPPLEGIASPEDAWTTHHCHPGIQWYFYDKRNPWRPCWKRVDDQDAALMEQAIARNENRVSFWKRGWRYEVDLERMVQFNMSRRVARSLLRVVGSPSQGGDLRMPEWAAASPVPPLFPSADNDQTAGSSAADPF